MPLRPSPTALFVFGALALAAGVGVLATRQAEGAEKDVTLPSDATAFGFAIRSTANGVPLLESTKPFELSLSNGPVHGTPPSAAQLNVASRLVARELDRYPPSFLKKIRLAGVVFASDLSEGDGPIPSLPNVGGLLLIDATSMESDLVRCFHHEVFHFFDLIDDGVVSPDVSWEALNAPAFSYGSGGRTLRGAWAAKTTTEIPGFLSAYATSGVEEDKADLFAYAVARPAVTREHMRDDRFLTAKVSELVRRVEAVDPEASRRLGLDSLVAK